MRDLQVNTGVETFTINGGHQISFSPTDTDFAQRVYETLGSMTDLQEKYGALGAELPDEDLESVVADPAKAEELRKKTEELLDGFRKMDAEMREKIDALFGDGTAQGVFGTQSLYSFADGLPVWANFLLAVLETFPEAAEKQAALTDPRLHALAGKYSGKYAQRNREARRQNGKRRNGKQ